MATLDVTVVSVERAVWEGEATGIITRTVVGEIGILPGHEPFLGMLADGVLRIDLPDGGRTVIAVHGGFISVDQNVVKVLAELAELGSEVDLERAEAAKQRALEGGAEDTEEIAAIHRAESRIDAAMRHERLTGLGRAR
jgi:F-type H+-transporting ATPase subunit epsilon